MGGRQDVGSDTKKNVTEQRKSYLAQMKNNKCPAVAFRLCISEEALMQSENLCKQSYQTWCVREAAVRKMISRNDKITIKLTNRFVGSRVYLGCLLVPPPLVHFQAPFPTFFVWLLYFIVPTGFFVSHNSHCLSILIRIIMNSNATRALGVDSVVGDIIYTGKQSICKRTSF